MEEATNSTFGDLLKALRKQKRLTQQELAARIGIHRNTIGGWERGDFLPDSKTIILELARQLQLDAHDTRCLVEASLTALFPYWQIPYPRNPFFTGREDILQQLRAALSRRETAILSQSYTLSGLGGIGKTQTAIEFAYRYAEDYSAVFWISAETAESFTASAIAIAELLNLPEKQDQEQRRIVAAVTHWLSSHTDWLLICDNVEDPAPLKSIMPAARHGSLIITSRRQALGLTARTLNLEQMTPEEGLRFLLCRARLLDPTSSPDHLRLQEIAAAREIVAEMDGLPLALDQAGAYIEATRCSLSDYLQLLKAVPLRLLDEREAHADHPASVARTFALAFEQLEQSYPAAIEIVTVCAFLAPEAIPETFFNEGATYLGPDIEKLAADTFQFQDAIKALLAYSLIQRNAETYTITIHRLVQAVLRGRLPEAEQRIWAGRVMEAMAHLFLSDEYTQVNYWQTCEQLLPHALACLTLSEPWNENKAVRMTVLNHVASYLLGRARYEEARRLYQQALQIGEQALDAEYLPIVETLRGLGIVYRMQGKYAQATFLLQRALRLQEQANSTEGGLTAKLLNSLGILYREQGKYALAEPLYQRALHIYEHLLGPDHSRVGQALNNLGNLYFEQGKYDLAEPLFQRALSIKEKAHGPEHPQVGHPLNNLGYLYTKLDRYDQAEASLQRALRIWEQAHGPEHPLVANALQGLADIALKQGNYEQAQALHQRALVLLQRHLGPDHLDVAESLHALAYIHEMRQQDAEAYSLYQQALNIRERVLGPDHPKTKATRSACAHLR